MLSPAAFAMLWFLTIGSMGLFLLIKFMGG